MTARLLAFLERRHRARTTRWNAIHPKPCVTTRKAKP